MLKALGPAARSQGDKLAACLKQKRHLYAKDLIVLNRDGLGCGGEVGRGKFGSINPSAINQTLQTDQKGIARESGDGGVRRITVAQRAEWKNLPNSLACGC